MTGDVESTIVTVAMVTVLPQSSVAVNDTMALPVVPQPLVISW